MFVNRFGKSILTFQYLQKKPKHWRCRGLNPGPLTCEASALPLSYIPTGIREYCATSLICFRYVDINTNYLFNLNPLASVGGVKVSIVAFQAIDPGSIPG